MNKEQQKQHLIDMMKKDEELGLYEYIGECKGNDGNGCFMDSSGHDCGCYTRSIKQETEHLLSTKANKEIKLEDIFNDEKRQGVKELIDTHKQDDENYLDSFGVTKTQFEVYRNFNKQETLEEASWKFNPLKKLDGEFLRRAFKEGAKWQQEISYSEEEVIAFGEFIFKHSLLTHTRGVKSLFEQFKKK